MILDLVARGFTALLVVRAQGALLHVGGIGLGGIGRPSTGGITG
jgi:hypothetical protein